MKYLIFIALVLTYGCSIFKKEVVATDVEAKSDVEVITSKVDTASTKSKVAENTVVIDNSITEIVEVKVDSTNKVITTTTTKKKNNVVTCTSTLVEEISTSGIVEKKDSTSKSEFTDNSKSKVVVERSSYGIYGIVFFLIILVLLVLKYYKKILSLFL